MMQRTMNTPRFAFFGTSRFSIIVLDTLKSKGFTPVLIVTAPDSPQGRKLVMTPPPAKIWAEENRVAVVQPEKLKNNVDLVTILKDARLDLSVVASYGKIIPAEFLSIPTYRTVNVHPSLLPRYRGSSPIQSAILGDDSKTGVTIIELDAEMDHGPILAQKELSLSEWPLTYTKLESMLGTEGGSLLSELIPSLIKGNISPVEQAHDKAIFTKKLEKKDGEIKLEDDPRKNLLKVKAFSEWPGTYFFTERNGKPIRVIIKDAILEDGIFTPVTVVPEGKHEMSYQEYLRGSH